MPGLDTLERIADAKSALVIALLFAVCMMGIVIYRLYRDKNRAHARYEELGDKMLKLMERIYERYVDDLRAGRDVAELQAAEPDRRGHDRGDPRPETPADRQPAHGDEPRVDGRAGAA